MVVYDAVPIQPNFCQGESSNNVESGNYSDSGNYIQPGNYVVDSGGYFGQANETFEEDQKPIIRDGSIQPCTLFADEQIGCDVQDENAVNLETPNNNVFVADSCYSDIPIDTNYMPDEPFMDPNNNLPLSDGLYLETNDLGSTLQDGFNFEDYLNFFDDEDAQNLSIDVSQLMGSEDALPGQESLDQKVRVLNLMCLDFLCVKYFLTYLLHQQPYPEELEKEAAEGKEAMEIKESGEGSSSKQDADVTDFDSGNNTQMFIDSSSNTNHLLTDSDSFETNSCSFKVPFPQKGEPHVWSHSCSVFIFFPVQDKGCCNPATRSPVFRLSSRYCRYDPNIEYGFSSG